MPHVVGSGLRLAAEMGVSCFIAGVVLVPVPAPVLVPVEVGGTVGVVLGTAVAEG